MALLCCSLLYAWALITSIFPRIFATVILLFNYFIKLIYFHLLSLVFFVILILLHSICRVSKLPVAFCKYNHWTTQMLKQVSITSHPLRDAGHHNVIQRYNPGLWVPVGSCLFLGDHLPTVAITVACLLSLYRHRALHQPPHLLLWTTSSWRNRPCHALMTVTSAAIMTITSHDAGLWPVLWTRRTVGLLRNNSFFADVLVLLGAVSVIRSQWLDNKQWSNEECADG